MAGNLRIGATADLSEITSGMADSVEAVRAAAQNISASFEEVHGRTKTAWAGLGEDVKAGAAQITQAQLDIATATKAHAAALADLRRVYTITKGDTVSEAEGLALLAAAQTKVAETSANLAAAKGAESKQVVESNEAEQLSENALVATFQRADAAISEGLEGLQERFYLTAQGARLSARDISGALTGLGEVLGVGLAADWAKDAIDSLAELNIELDHLSAETGISITSLAGLRLTVKELGVEWEPVQRGIQRLGKALEEGRFGEVEYSRALVAIGVQLRDLNGKSAEEQLGIIAEGFRRTTDQAKVSYAATELFSRGGIALIPVLREYGAGIVDVMHQQGKLTGVTEQSAAAARRWTADVQRLTAQFHAVMMPVLENAENVVYGIAGVFHFADFVITGFFEEISGALVGVVDAIMHSGKAIADVFHGDFAGAMRDSRSMSDTFRKDWGAAAGDVDAMWQKVVHDFTYEMPVPKLPEFEGADLSAVPKPGRSGRDGAFRKDEVELNQARLDAARQGHSLSLAEEDQFWERKLASAKKGTAEYQAIVSKLAELKERELRARKGMDEMRVVEPDMSSAAQEMISELKDQARTKAQIARQETDAYRSSLDEQMRMAEESLNDRRQDLGAELAAHKITLAEKIKAEIAAVNETKHVYTELMDAKKMLDMGDAAAYQRDLNQQEEANRRFARQIVLIQRQNAQQTEAAWREGLAHMTRDFNGSVAQWTVTGRGFEQSMAQIMGGITSNFIQNTAKMIEQEIMAAIMHKSLAKQEIFADAKSAGAAGFKWGMKYGGPAAPVVAPIAAAAAFAGVLAFESFDAGGVVRGPSRAAVPILAHAGERVLTPQQTQNFETLVNTRNEGARSSSVNVGPVTQNFHDSKPSPREMQRSIQSLARNGKLRLSY